MTSKNTNITPITKARSVKRFLSRYFAGKRSKSEAEDDSPSLGAPLYPDAVKLQDLLTIPGKDANVNVPDAKPWSFVGPAPNFGQYPDFSTASVYPVPPVFPEDTNMMVELIRISLSESSQLSGTLFLNCTVPISREQFLKSRGVVDGGQGAVFAFYNEQKAVYVGTTGSKVKSLLKESNSPLVDAAWWPNWTHMRFLPLTSASDRMILEDLLILSLEPIANQRPGAAVVRQFLTEIEGD